MFTFLGIWLLAGLALGISVAVLSLAYNAAETDFGTEGWRRETVIVLITAAVQAGAAVLVLHLVGESNRYAMRAVYLLGTLTTALGYKVTHIRDMTGLEITVLIATNSAVLLLLSFVVRAVLG